MTERFRRHLEALVGGDVQKHYLLAVSGGADSSVMAHLFHEAGLDFAFAHCNFHLRGEDSNRDMQMVQSLANQWDVPLFIREFDTLALRENSGLSIEMIARNLRYAWFEEIGREYDFIATAHQADDVAETLLLNLCRGTGLKGLASIPPRNGKIIRPMLPFSAEEIRQYAHDHHIHYAVDCTNTDEQIKRNRIRHSVLPVLKELNPNLIPTITRNCDIFRRQQHFFQRAVENIKEELVTPKEDGCVVDWNTLAQHPDREVILYEILSDFGFSSAVVTDLCNHTDVQTGVTHTSPTHTLLVNRDTLEIRPTDTVETETFVLNSLEDLQQFFTVEKIQTGEPIVFPKGNKTLFIPMEKLTFPLTLRSWKHGDFFYPLGGNGRQKLSDFFSDHKINQFQKQKIRLLCAGDAIIWIVGLRSDERFKITDKNASYVKISVKGK